MPDPTTKAAEVARLLLEHARPEHVTLGRSSMGARHDRRSAAYAKRRDEAEAAILAIVRELECTLDDDRKAAHAAIWRRDTRIAELERERDNLKSSLHAATRDPRFD